MKLITSLLVIVALSTALGYAQPSTLPLLEFKKEFKAEIIEPTYQRSKNNPELILINVQKNKTADRVAGDDYEIFVCALNPEAVDEFKGYLEKYYGYFKYKDCLVMVYENYPYDSAVRFFKQTKSKERFNFLKHKKRDADAPPIVIEPHTELYKFINGKYSGAHAASVT